MSSPAFRPSPRRSLRRRAACVLLALALLLVARLRATTAAYLVSSGAVSLDGQTFTATAPDTSAIGVNGTGRLTLADCTISTTGDTSSSDDSSFYGLNAGILVETGGTLTMSGGSITTSGLGANGLFAYGSGAATLSGVTVKCSGRYAHAVMAAGGGTLAVANLTATTTGANSGAIATDRGGGSIRVQGGTVETTGADSPAIYSTGTVTVSDASLTASAAEAVVIEGLNTTALVNCTTRGGSSSYGAVLVVQSQSGDAATGTAKFSVTGGSLTATAGPLFFVTNTAADLSLTGATVSAGDGTLIHAAGTARWGTSGSNGGVVTFTASGETLAGALTADAISSIAASLTNSTTLTGAATGVALTIDATSTWQVTAPSTLTSLTTAGTVAFADVDDTISVNGSATLGGRLIVTPPALPGTYTLLTADAIGGTFSSYGFSTALAYGLTSSLAYTSTAVTLTVSGVALATHPAITAQPSSHAVALGRSAAFSVAITAGSGSLIYQWYKDGVALLGATAAQLLLRNVTAADAGSYSVVATDFSGAVTSAAATLTVVATDDPGRLVNLSVLAHSGTGSDVLIAGFVLGGAGTSGSRPVLLRSMGPSLAAFGVSGYMLDPTLALVPIGADSALLSNDDWSGATALSTTAATVGAFAFADTSSADAAALTSLASGAYTLVCAGADATTGTTLAEVYDAASTPYSATTPRLINISARGALGTSSLTAGFVIDGSTAVTVLLRGLGPYLATAAGLTGAIGNPHLTLYRSVDGANHVVATNEDWGNSAPLVAAAAQVGASAISSSSEAVLLLTLDPGIYTFSVADGAGGTGEALIEGYEVP